MPETFDAYYKWLGIPPEDQPPNHYRLLGIRMFEPDPDVITSAADKQMAHLRTFQAGQHSALSQKLLNEVATAKVCLLNPEKKTAYDQSLRQKLRPAALPTAQPLPDSFRCRACRSFRDADRKYLGDRLEGPRARNLSPSLRRLSPLAALTAVAVGFAVWVTIGHDSTPNDARNRKGCLFRQLRPSRPRKPLPKSAEPSRKEAPIAASTAPKEESQGDDAKTVPEPKPPEPKTEEETTTAAVAGKTVEAKPASKDPPADKPNPMPNRPPPRSLLRRRRMSRSG